MPHWQKAAFEARLRERASNFRQAALQGSSKLLQRLSERGKVARIVSEIHRPAPVAGLASGINGHRISAVSVGRGARVTGEELARGQ